MEKTFNSSLTLRAKWVIRMKMLSVIVTVVCLVFVSSLVLIPNVFSQASDPNVKVLNYSWYINPSGNFVVVGEVRNVGTSVIQTMTLNVMVIGSGGGQLVSGTTMPYVSYLLPQQKAPFYLDLGNPGTNTTPDVSSVDFTVSNAGKTNDKEYAGLSLRSAFNSTANGVYTVLGLVSNIGDQTANDIRVVGTFYNSAGTVVAVGFIKLNDALIPDNASAFALTEFDATPSLVAQISNCSLLIQTATLQNSESPSTSPTPTSTSSSGSPDLIYIAIVVVVIVVVVATALVFLRKRHKLPLPPPPPP